MKFKVGDKVRVVDGRGYGEDVGFESEISRIRSGYSYPIKLREQSPTGWTLFYGEQLELVEETEACEEQMKYEENCREAYNLFVKWKNSEIDHMLLIEKGMEIVSNE